MVSYVVTVVLPAQKSSTTDEPANDIRHNRPVQVRHDHHVELVRFRNELHAAVVDDHVIVLDVGVFLSDAARRFKE